MADATITKIQKFQLDRVWVFAALMPVAMVLVDPEMARETMSFALAALAHTGWFIGFAVLAVGYLKATGSEALLAKAFEGRETKMILMAALLGGLSPFCSCEVIPFIAAMLAVGAPLSAVMAFWLSSPLMDPAMFLITAGTLGLPFAVAKTVAAVGMGLLGGTVVYLLKDKGLFADPLREQPSKSGCCGCGPSPFQGKPKWKFWHEQERLNIFRATVVDNALFLLKWLLIAYMFEALMIRYIPAETIAGILGGNGLLPIFLGAVVGAPAYLNGYAAVPLVDALLTQGMAAGAAMSFVVAGGVSSIPAAIAVWALVKPRVFVGYLGLAMVGALIAGVLWSAIA